MYCNNCGSSNDDKAMRCANCGTILQRVQTTTVDVPDYPPAEEEKIHTPRIDVPQHSPQETGEDVPNYLVASILLTIFSLPLIFFLIPTVIFGVIAIVYAAQVNGLVASGNYARAARTSRLAKIWCWVTFGTTLAVYVIGGLVLLFILILAAAGLASV